jgi:hypothetical protein
MPHYPWEPHTPALALCPPALPSSSSSAPSRHRAWDVVGSCPMATTWHSLRIYSSILEPTRRHFRLEGCHPTEEEMAHWIQCWAGCCQGKSATWHTAIALMRWTNEGEGQLCNIPSGPKINFILHSVASGSRGA